MTKFDFPETRQFYLYDCGAAAMLGVLAYYGFDNLSEQSLMTLARTNKRSGTSVEELKQIARKFGLKYKEGSMSIPKLKMYVRKKIPVIILIQNIWIDHNLKNDNYLKQRNCGHYVIPIGFNEDKFFFEDPASCFRTYLTFSELERIWSVVRMKKKRSEKIEHYGIAFFGRPIYKKNEVAHMGFDFSDAYKHIPAKIEKF